MTNGNVLSFKERRKFYASAEWLRIRAVCLQRDHYLCQDCLKRKKAVLAEAVHHDKPLAEYPELALDIDNLVSLCSACHNERHGFKGKRKKKPVPQGVRVIKA